MLAVTVRTSYGRFDVVSTTPVSTSGPCTPSQRHLDALATKAGEKCRLASRYPWLCLAAALVLSPSLRAAPVVHLLGFVDKLCPTEAYCFDFLVESDFIARVGERIKLRFGAKTNIYDPENYELNLVQQNIVAGSHLRMLIEADANGLPGEYRATFIWIGD